MEDNKEFDWWEYEREKEKLREKNLSPQEYYAEIQKICDKLGI